jgi:hypothetical protein
VSAFRRAVAIALGRPRDGVLQESLHAAIECVLLDHEDQLGGEDVDANLSELAYCYRQLTGWTVADEDVPR